MNPILAAALGAIAPAVASIKTKLAGEIGDAIAVEVPKLTDEGLQALETVVAPKLDVPQVVIDEIKGFNPTIEGTVDPFLIHELDLLVARLPSLPT